MATEFQAGVVDALSSGVDQANMDLLADVIDAANEVASTENITDVTLDGEADDEGNYGTEAGAIGALGMEASLMGTGGVALLEFAKDTIQTIASNVSSTGTQEMQAKKLVERKMAG